MNAGELVSVPRDWENIAWAVVDNTIMMPVDIEGVLSSSIQVAKIPVQKVLFPSMRCGTMIWKN